MGWQSELQAGPMHFFNPEQVYGPDALVEIPAGDIYPPRPPMYGDRLTLQHEFQASSSEWLVITKLYHFWMPADFTVQLNGVELEPARETSVNAY